MGEETSLGWVLIAEAEGSSWTLLGMLVLAEAEMQSWCFLLMPSLHLSGLLKSLLPGKEQAMRIWQSTKLNFNILIKGPLCIFDLCAFFFYRPCLKACRILVPVAGVEPGPLAVKAWSPNHWALGIPLCALLSLVLTFGPFITIIIVDIFSPV